jgi:hypothetical protein
MLSSNVPLNSSKFGLFTHCENETIGKCFFITIRYGKLLVSINASHVLGNTTLKANIWYHVAYIYDRISLTQSLYLIEQLDGIFFSSDISICN